MIKKKVLVLCILSVFRRHANGNIQRTAFRTFVLSKYILDFEIYKITSNLHLRLIYPAIFFSKIDKN